MKFSVSPHHASSHRSSYSLICVLTCCRISSLTGVKHSILFKSILYYKQRQQPLNLKCTMFNMKFHFTLLNQLNYLREKRWPLHLQDGGKLLWSIQKTYSSPQALWEWQDLRREGDVSADVFEDRALSTVASECRGKDPQLGPACGE